jgi:hypothetical protein
MPVSQQRPTPALQQTIAAYIRAGGFPHVAAEAAGVPRALFEKWLRRGQQPKAAEDLRAFYQAILQARAQARIRAELAVFKARPLDWLRSGPGKETNDNPGWTGNVKAGGSAEGEVNPLLEPVMQQMFVELMAALGPFPEARAAVATAYAEQKGEVP